MTEIQWRSWLQAHTAHMVAAPADHHAECSASTEPQSCTRTTQIENGNIMAQIWDSERDRSENNGTKHNKRRVKATKQIKRPCHRQRMVISFCVPYTSMDALLARKLKARGNLPLKPGSEVLPQMASSGPIQSAAKTSKQNMQQNSINTG